MTGRTGRKKKNDTPMAEAAPEVVPFELTVKEDSLLTYTSEGEVKRHVISVDAGLETLHETDPLITLAEFARRINKHNTTIWRWAKDGLFETTRAPSGLMSVRVSVANTFLRGTAITGRV